jgi:hypothetical protein
MFIKLTEKDGKILQKAGVHWASEVRSNSWDIHKVWLDKCVESTLVKHYTVNNDGHADITFHDNTELFKVYKKTIIDEHNRGVEIHYSSGLNELSQDGYDGWSLDVGNLEGKFLDEYLQAMGDIAQIRSNIKSYQGGK